MLPVYLADAKPVVIVTPAVTTAAQALASDTQSWSPLLKERSVVMAHACKGRKVPFTPCSVIDVCL